MLDDREFNRRLFDYAQGWIELRPSGRWGVMTSDGYMIDDRETEPDASALLEHLQRVCRPAR